MKRPISTTTAAETLPPRERIMQAANELFTRLGIQRVGVDLIAKAAASNKMTLYQHYGSKDELVAEWLRQVASRNHAIWDGFALKHRGDPKGELIAWARFIADKLSRHGDRGCPFMNSLAELPDKDHPARPVIESYKSVQRARLMQLCRAAAIPRPELVADQLFFMLDGAQSSAQGVGVDRVGERLVQIVKSLVMAEPESV